MKMYWKIEYPLKIEFQPEFNLKSELLIELKDFKWEGGDLVGTVSSKRWVLGYDIALQLLKLEIKQLIDVLQKYANNFNVITLGLHKIVYIYFIYNPNKKNLELIPNWQEFLINSNFINKDNIISNGINHLTLKVPFYFTNFDEMLHEERSLFSAQEYEKYVPCWAEPKTIAFSTEDAGLFCLDI